jgi:uncharacterized protein with GYD domain
MPTYVLLTNLAAPGLETLHKSPDRLKEVNEELSQYGCKLIAQYALLGPYDFLNIIEAPDNETMAHLSVDLGARARPPTSPCRRSRPTNWPSGWAGKSISRGDRALRRLNRESQGHKSRQSHRPVSACRSLSSARATSAATSAVVRVRPPSSMMKLSAESRSTSPNSRLRSLAD